MLALTEPPMEICGRQVFGLMINHLAYSASFDYDRPSVCIAITWLKLVHPAGFEPALLLYPVKSGMRSTRLRERMRKLEPRLEIASR